MKKSTVFSVNAPRFVDDTHVCVTKSFAKNARIFGTTEYKMWRAIKADCPDAEMVTKLEGDPYFDGDEIQKTFLKAIQSLPEKQRMVFNLKYFKEMKYEDISQILGTSIGALKASYHHAVKKIEAFFKEEDLNL